MYTGLLSILGLSFLLGIRHATDTDHVVAVSAIISKQKKGILHSAMIGLLWAIGHSITVTLVAIPIIYYSVVIPSQISLLMELLVGIMLVTLGLLNLFGKSLNLFYKYLPFTIHKHQHKESNIKHSHLHIHPKRSLTKEFHHLGLFQTIRPLVVGLIHGLAGSTAIALLILSTIQKPAFALIYLFIFHIGIFAGMVLVTLCLGASLNLLKKRSEKINNYFVMVSGLLSLAFGLFIISETTLGI